MCNAWNHSPGCTCGWGGEGHLGYSPGYMSSPVAGHFTWKHRDENFCRPTTCPHCGAVVFFVRHNGGSVWFDELGAPWPKHECFAHDGYSIQLNRLLLTPPDDKIVQAFGIIIETETTRPGEAGRIVIRCSDGSIIDEVFTTKADLSTLIGQIAVVFSDDDGGMTLQFVVPDRQFVSPRRYGLIAYLRIVDSDSYSVQENAYKTFEEYPYRQKADVEKRFHQLQAAHPGRYFMETVKRYEYYTYWQET